LPRTEIEHKPVIWEPQDKQRIALEMTSVYELFYGGA
jgi:hypothetical protein